MFDGTARVTRIQKFCVHDGPGIRTTVFFKGCGLRCAWCHNPETRSPRPAVLYSEKLCIFCARCMQACAYGAHDFANVHTILREKCVSCGACADACPTGALEMDVKTMSIHDIMREVLRDRAFYGAAGGLTVSGGEPMFQPEACLALLKEAKNAGITTAIETSGFFDKVYLSELASVTDTFLWDFKDSDPERHIRYTGQTNAVSLENLRGLEAWHANVRLRCIMVEGVNMTHEHMKAIADVFHEHKNVRSVELLPYHAYGASKAAQAGETAEAHREWIPSPGRMEEMRALLTEMGAEVYRR